MGGNIGFTIMFIIVGTLIFGISVFTFLLIFSPKIRGKFMSKQVKATKYMIDETKDDIKSITTDLADATKDSIETTTRAIRKGFTTDESMFCRYCGHKIDRDSVFCNKCGKKQ